MLNQIHYRNSTRGNSVGSHNYSIIITNEVYIRCDTEYLHK